MPGRTPTDSHHLQFNESGSSSSRIENPSVSTSESLTDPILPEELIAQILLGLPVKSLIKFRCVSKSWLSLISTPQFIMSHFSRSSREGEYLNLQLLCTYHHPAHAIKQCSLYSALHEAEPSAHVSAIEFPYQNPVYPTWIVGTANGLVCLHINANDLTLWNPVLRKSKPLPGSNVNMELPSRTNYSFGYDESNDDYKVVSLLSVYGSDVLEVEVEIYSLRADSRSRRIEDLKGFLPTQYPGRYANGKIYWYAYQSRDGASSQNKKIVSLDIASEKFGELQQPPYEAGGDYDWKLGVLGGRPFVLYDYCLKKADLWVMDKYGVEGSWCKMVSIPYDNVHLTKPYSHHQVLCILGRGEIVLENGHGLLVYHSKRKASWNIELDVGSTSKVLKFSRMSKAWFPSNGSYL